MYLASLQILKACIVGEFGHIFSYTNLEIILDMDSMIMCQLGKINMVVLSIDYQFIKRLSFYCVSQIRLEEFAAQLFLNLQMDLYLSKMVSSGLSLAPYFKLETGMIWSTI